MKKFIIASAKALMFMTMFATLASTMTSCSKDDDKDSEDKRLKFVNNMMQSATATSCTWEGWHRREFKDGSSWTKHSQQYAVIQFSRSSATATSGEGIILYFADANKTDYKEGSKFHWAISDNQVKITQITHSEWYPMYAEYNTTEITVGAGTFYGHWWEKVNDRWEFNYKKSSFNEFSKYEL
jgi:hypothetical protein